MKKQTNSFILILFLWVGCSVSKAQNQPANLVGSFSKHRFSIHGNSYLHNLQINNVEGNVENLKSPFSLGYNFSLGYQFFLHKNHAFNLQIGSGSFQKNIYFEVNNINYDGLPERVDYISSTLNDYVSIGKVSYLFYFPEKNNFLSGLSAGCYFRNYWMYPDLTLGLYSVKALQDENEQIIGSTRFFDLEADIHGMTHVNPFLEYRIEYHDKHKNVFGLQLEVVIPFRTIFSGQTVIFPDIPEYTSSFDLKYRGGSVGLGLYFAFSRDKK